MGWVRPLSRTLLIVPLTITGGRLKRSGSARSSVTESEAACAVITRPRRMRAAFIVFIVLPKPSSTCPTPPRCTGPPRRPFPRGARRARGRVFHARDVEGRTPAPVIVLRELETENPDGACHRYIANARPRVEPRA